jgi:hypothetical protein
LLLDRRARYPLPVQSTYFLEASGAAEIEGRGDLEYKPSGGNEFGLGVETGGQESTKG